MLQQLCIEKRDSRRNRDKEIPGEREQSRRRKGTPEQISPSYLHTYIIPDFFLDHSAGIV